MILSFTIYTELVVGLEEMLAGLILVELVDLDGLDADLVGFGGLVDLDGLGAELGLAGTGEVGLADLVGFEGLVDLDGLGAELWLVGTGEVELADLVGFGGLLREIIFKMFPENFFRTC